MDISHPGVQSIAFALLLCVFLTTKSGKQLGARIFHHYIISSIMFSIPIKIRCKFVYDLFVNSSIPRSRTLLSYLLKPWGEQWDYITPVNMGGLKGHWITSPEEQTSLEKIEASAANADLIIYNIHGGGFTVGDSITTIDSLIYVLNHLKKTKGLNVRLFSIDYGLMPEVTYDRSKQDCLDGYRYLSQTLHVPAKKIIFFGDSAGGNLVAGCIQTIRDEPGLGLEIPLANALISPWICIERNANVQDNTIEYVDCIKYDALIAKLDNYFSTTDLKDKSISPLNGSFSGFCPTLVTYGGTEIFQHDIQQLIEKLKAEQVTTTVITRYNTTHTWFMYPLLSPTYKIWEEDLSKLADWCSEQVDK